MADFMRLMAFRTSTDAKSIAAENASATASFRLAVQDAIADMHAKGVTAVGIDENGNIVESRLDTAAAGSHGGPSDPKRI